jgi:hypothetical protein
VHAFAEARTSALRPCYLWYYRKEGGFRRGGRKQFVCGEVGLYDTYGNLGFRPAADAQYIAAGPAYSGSDDGWIEIAAGSGLVIFFQ